MASEQDMVTTLTSTELYTHQETDINTEQDTGYDPDQATWKYTDHSNAWSTECSYEQSAAWDLIFMANKKQQKKFPTKVTKKNKKKFKPFLDTQKKFKKRVLKYSVTKKGYN